MKRPRLRIIVQLIIVSALVAAGAVILGPVRLELARRFDVVKTDAIVRLEEYLGREITYESISPSVLRYVSIRGLRVHGRPGEPDDLLAVDAVRIYYRPLRILQGNYSEGFSQIRIENTVIHLDATIEADLSAILSDIGGDSNTPDSELALPQDLTVVGRNVTLVVATDLGSLEVSGIFLDASLDNDVITLRSQGGVALSGVPESMPVRTLSGQVEASGTINARSGDTLLEVSLPEIQSDIGIVRSQILQIRFADGRLEARNVQSRDPVDIYVRYLQETEEIYARILSDGYRISELVELRGDYAQYNPYLDLPLRGQVSATYSSSGLNYSGSILTAIDALDIPSGEITVQFSGSEKELQIEQLSYISDIGDLAYQGSIGLSPLRPSGDFSVRRLTLPGYLPITVSGSIQSTANQVQFSTGGFSYAGVPIREILGSVELGDQPTGDFQVSLRRGDSRYVSIQTVHDSTGRVQSAAVDARSIDPFEILSLQQELLPSLELPDLSFLPDSVLLDTRAKIDLRSGLHVTVPLFYCWDPDSPGDHISFALDYDDGEIALTDVTAGYSGYSGTGLFHAFISDQNNVEFVSDITVEGIPYQFTGSYSPEKTLFIEGLYDVSARLFFGERGELVFDVRGDIPVPFSRDYDTHARFASHGYFFDLDDWDLAFDRLEVREIPVATLPNSTFGLIGRFGPGGAVVSDLSFRDAYSSVRGNAHADWDIASRSGTAALVLGSADGSENYELSVAYADGITDSSAVFTRLPLLRVGIEALRGSISGNTRVTGALDDLAIRVEAAVLDGKFNNDPVELQGVVAVDSEGLRIESASGRYVRTVAEGVTGSLSLTTGAFEAEGSLRQNGEGGGFQIGLKASGSFDDLADIGGLLTEEFQGELLVSGLSVEEDLPSDWQFAVSRRGAQFSVSGGPDEAIALTIEESGKFRGRLQGPLPVAFEAIGLISKGEFEADLIGVSVDVGRVWKMVESPGFAFTGGTGTGSLRLVGPLNDPDFYGTLLVDGLTGTVDMIPQILGPARSYMVFEEKIINVRETTVGAGDGQARVSCAVSMDRWLPQEFAVWIRVLDEHPIEVVNDFGGVAISGDARGDLEIRGDMRSTTITGDLTASAMDITLSASAPPPDPDEDPGDLRVDVTVTTDRGVQFLWPTNALPILRGFADMGETVDISYRSAFRSHSVIGGVDIQGGEVFYFDRSFYVKDGRITFDEDESGFDPLLTINAEIREVADEGPVRIYLVAEERPLSQFVPTWKSDPPLSEAAILALLGGTVFVTQDGSPIDLSQAVLLTSDLVSQYGIIRGFENTIRDTLQLDLFSIRTQLFQNLLRGVIDPIEYPLDSDTPSLGKYLDNTTLFLGKYLGTDLFLELLVQMRATDPVSTESRSLAGIAIDPEVSLEWRTPFFMLEWAFFPRDPSTLFLSDNTIRFSWEYSY